MCCRVGMHVGTVEILVTVHTGMEVDAVEVECIKYIQSITELMLARYFPC